MTDSPRDRYDRDPKFRMLVTAMYKMIEGCEFSGSEIREAAMLALIMYEERHLPGWMMGYDGYARRVPK